MEKRNYQKEMEKVLEQLEKEGKVPKLLLHSCCTPCSTYVIQYLSNRFEVTVFYYNPNIDDEREYIKRSKEQMRLIDQLPTKYPVAYVEGNYDVERFYEMAKPLAHCKEGEERCFKCYALRLGETAKYAKEHDFDIFATTLTISPLKNATKLNEIGEKLGDKWCVPYLDSDFKKKNGYRQSVLMSETYGLYRQDYCGCSYSKAEMLRRE